MGQDYTDILVIGAGVAGLSAASDLSAAGLSVRVLEARDRIGGRIYTRRDAGRSPIELGAEFIHGLPEATWALVRAGPLPVYESAGEDWSASGGAISRGDGRLWADVDELFGRMAGVPDQTFAEFVAPYLREERWRAAAELATAYVEGFDAAQADRIGVHSLLREQRASEAIEGDRSFCLRGGYDEVARVLAADLGSARSEIRLGAVVTAVEWKAGEVVVSAQAAAGEPLGPFRARQAVVTLPLGVLKAPAGRTGHVAFVPELPEKELAAGRLEMGQAVKIVLRFRERFWADARLVAQPPGDGLEQLGFLRAPGAPVPTWWTAYPDPAPTLTGWAGGPTAARLLAQGRTEIFARALDSLAGALGLEQARLERLLDGWHFHDWQADPLARGAYSYVPAGALDAPDALAKPVAGTLFFAGEATDTTGRTGTVDGAIASGRRAARELLAARNPLT